MKFEQWGAGVGVDGRVPIICPKAAPHDYEYVIVTLYLFNNGDQKITINPSGWNLIADELNYEYSSTTFDISLGYQDIEIVKGGDIETIIVYLVKGHSTSAHLQYNRLCAMVLSFKQVKHYGNQSL